MLCRALWGNGIRNLSIRSLALSLGRHSDTTWRFLGVLPELQYVPTMIEIRG